MFTNSIAARKVCGLAALLCLWSSTVVAQVGAGGASCFPECRTGFVCTPDGKCVSECNPPCESEHLCVAGQCAVRDEGSAESAASSLALVAGVVYQIATDSYFEGSAPGLLVEFNVNLLAGFFVRPRTIIAFYPNLVQPEAFLDLGYRLAAKTKRGWWGATLTVSPGVWLAAITYNDPVGFYLGAQLTPFVQHNKLVFSLPIEYGLQTVERPDIKVITFGLSIGYAL